MRFSLRGTLSRNSRLAIALVASVAGLSACHTPVQTAAAPTPPFRSATAVVVRNSSLFEVNVYAMTAEDTPLWLGTVPPNGTWQVRVPNKALQKDGTLIVRTQALGASRVWTSGSVNVDASTYGLLDLSVSSTGDCSLSALRSVNAQELTPIMW